MAMKKILFSILTIGASLTGCTHLEEVSSEYYGEGPSITAEVTATADNSFTFVLTPSEGTLYYSYLVVEGDEVEEIDALSLLQNQLTGVATDCIEFAKNTTYTYDMKDEDGKELCSPNTSYVIYAVAANKEGVTGSVATVVVKTTDNVNPDFNLEGISETEGKVGVVIPFSENVTLAENKTVTAQYYVEWAQDGSNFVDIPTEDISLEVDGKNVTVTVQNVPAAAVVLVSWEEGTFIDSYGNKCAKLESGLNGAGTGFDGVYFTVTTEPFEITEENIVTDAGEDEEVELPLIWNKTDGISLHFENDIYRNEKKLKGGEIQLVLKRTGKEIILDLSKDDWSIEEDRKTLKITMPSGESQSGDIISLKIKEGAITDINGNPNKESLIEDYWMWPLGYDEVVQSCTLKAVSYFDEEQSYTDNITTNLTEKVVTLSGFLGSNKEVKGTLDSDRGLIYIEPQVIFDSKEVVIDKEGTKLDCSIKIEGNTDTGLLTLKVDEGGSLSVSGDMIIFNAYNADEFVTTFEAYVNCTFE